MSEARDMAARRLAAKMRPQQVEALRGAPRRVWLGASYLLGRPVPVDDLYPHVCQLDAPGLMTPNTWVKLRRLECAACLAKANLRPVGPEVTDEHRAIQARMLGEREDTDQ